MSNPTTTSHTVVPGSYKTWTVGFDRIRSSVTCTCGSVHRGQGPHAAWNSHDQHAKREAAKTA